MYPLQLSGSQVALREFCSSDTNRIMAVVGDDRVTESLSFDTRSREQAAEMLKGILSRAKQEPRTEYYLAVTTVEGGLVAIVGRLGMTYEGCIRDHVYTNGRWRDSLLYSVLADEWDATEPGVGEIEVRPGHRPEQVAAAVRTVRSPSSASDASGSAS